MVTAMDRDFRGIWISSEIWLTKDMTVGEKLMYVEIESLSKLDRGCFASNAHFAEMFSISPSRVSEIISSLASKGFILVDQKRQGVRTVQRIIRVIPLHATSSENPKNPFGKGVEGSSEKTQGKNTDLSNTEKEGALRDQQADHIPYEEIFNTYERVLPGKPRVKIRDDARRKAIRSLWRSNPKFQAIEFWERYYAVVKSSKFLMDSKSLAFDWLHKPANFKKVAEGNYSE
jgi:hypothetical protein